jgi:branched-chain amino acid transport system substrate-binding protein
MTVRNSALVGTMLAAALCLATAGAAAQGKLKVGLMLPYTGTYAALGNAIENGFRLYVAEQGGKLGGLEPEYFKVDDESEPSKAVDNINKLIKRDNVDVVVGTVHSGVAMAMAKVAKDTNTLLVVPNAGARAVTGAMCAPNIFRSSFSNWQPGYAMGKVAGERGAKKVATITWKYAAGDESVEGFKDGLKASGGDVVKELTLPFPNVEFQALLTEIAATKPDAVYAFFAGGGAVAAQGMLTTLHYGDGLNTPKDNAFRANYSKTYKAAPDVYAVQGYDAAQMLGIGLSAVKGDIAKRSELVAAMEKARIDSPRGTFTLSKSHDPVQDIYLRKVVGTENHVEGVAVTALADPSPGCKM